MANDKFILMGLDDDRAKKVAEAIGNATCKKIIDYLSEINEASEKDISTALNIPINTAEYNLKKLIDAGLVERTKNFFWSTKGRKIEMFKLAKKHIVISPKSKRPNMNALKTILPVVIVALVLVALILFLSQQKTIVEQSALKQFANSDELKNFLKENTEPGLYSYSRDSINAVTSSVAPSTSMGTAKAESAGAGGSAQDFSKTNIQVEGVDEPDIVKNDGKYIYAATDNKVSIINAYPAENMKIISELNFTQNVEELFINGDSLIVFSQGYQYTPYAGTECLASYGYKIGCGGSSEYKSMVYIYNIKDKENPTLEQNISADGNYIDSRMIGDYVYVISNKQVNIDNPEPPIYITNGVEKEAAVSDVYYWPYPDENYVFTSIMAINVESGESNSEVYLTGYTGTIYVSQENIYLTHAKRISPKEYNQRLADEVYMLILPASEKSKVQDIMSSDKAPYEKQNLIRQLVQDYSDSLSGKEKSDFAKELLNLTEKFELSIAKENQKTAINKINVNKDKIDYIGNGEVPGTLLNQFSMDEYDGYFRAATTTGEVWSGNSLNHLYILDKSLNIIGKVEDLAHGEKIYSTRFLGNRAYIVTFKKVDPLFVIDLKDPQEPKVLGYLKITGFSDYLHPYDENHIIGIGKEAVVATDEQTSSLGLNFAWYQGLKISLFDVSDVSNPVESAKIVIGDRGTDSEALYEHKAFLFDKSKNLLVIPVSLAEIDRSKYKNCTEEESNSYNSYSCLTANTYGQQVWEGAYVLNINLNEISIRGKITHTDAYTPKYGAAKDDEIGAVRQVYGSSWTKKGENKWAPDSAYDDNSRYYEYSYTDEYMDEQEGGINYKEYIYDYSNKIRRSLYMDDVLYTISQGKVKANNLQTVEEISRVNLPHESNYGGVIYRGI